MNIILGVCGSVSAYKSYDLTRRLVEKGHILKVVLTSGAEKFIKPELFKYLGAKEVFSAEDDFNLGRYKIDDTVLHIHLARWMDQLIIAPASANSISRLARAEASDLLTSLLLANQKKPVLICPAMNSSMWHNPLFKKNLEILQSLENIWVYPPSSGALACQENGEGKLAPIDFIAESFHTFRPYKKEKKKILITTGATAAILDPIRYLTNGSTGETGLRLAQYYLAQGHEVTVVATPSSTPLLESLVPNPRFQLHRISSTKEVHQKVLEIWPDFNIYISAAALSDFEFQVHENKLKKNELGQNLAVTPAPDVLSSVIKSKGKDQIVIGFAAESPLNPEILREKYQKKPVDLLVGNEVAHGLSGQTPQGFGESQNEYVFLKNEQVVFSGLLHKRELPEIIEKFWGNP